MFTLEKFRLPYREDTAFGLLAFCVFVVPLAFSLFSFENFESVKFALFLIFTGASAVAFLTKGKQVDGKDSSHKYFLGLLFAFGFWAALSALFAQDRLYAFFGFYYRYTSGLVFYAAFGLFIWLLVKLADLDRLKFLLKIVIADALAVCLVTYLQAFGWIFYAGPEQNGVFHGPSLLGNPNYSAMFLACVLPLALYFFSRSRKFGQKIYYALATFSMIFSCVLLASRGALLAIAASGAAALLLLAVSRVPRKIFWGLLGTLVLLGGLGYWALSVSRPGAVSTIVSAVDSNTVSRFYAWEVSIRGIGQHPLVGSGPGNYALFFEHTRGADPLNQGGVFDDAHNLFLHLAVTGGLPLLLLFLLLLLLPAQAALKNLYLTGDFLPLAQVSSLTAWVVAAGFNPVPIPMYLLLAILLTGMLPSSFSQKPAISLRVWKKYSLLLFGLALMAWGVANLASEHLLGLSRSAYNNIDYSRALKLARLSGRLNPGNAWYLIYQTASEISLGYGRAEIERDIKTIQNFHPLQAGSFVEASNLYAALYFNTHERQDAAAAITGMRQALAMDPSFADRYGQLALLYYQAGDKELAQANVQRNLALNSGNFSAWIFLAKLYQEQGKKQQTVWALTKAFNLQPDNRQLKYLLELAKNLPDIQQVPLEISPRQPGV